MVAIGVSTHTAALDAAQAEAPEFEKVTWYSDPGLRKLYFWCAVLCVASATTGYDGYVFQILTAKMPETNIVVRMMLNTAQAIDLWQTYFGAPAGSRLGLMNAIYQIGSLISFPF